MSNDVFLYNLVGMDITKNNESMLRIRNGGLPVETAEGFMRVLMGMYYRSDYAVGIENVIKGVTYNLAMGVDEAEDRLKRARNQLEFAGMGIK